MTGFEGYGDAVLLAVRANLQQGLAKAHAHVEAGTFFEAGSKHCPPAGAAALTLMLLEGVEETLTARGLTLD